MRKIILLAAVIVMFAAPITASAAPFGWLDSADCSSFKGWSCDGSNYSQYINVNFWSEGGWFGWTTANQPREQGVANACGGYSWHGFNFTTPEWLINGKTHTIWAWGNNPATNSWSELSGSGKTIQCAPTSPTPTISANPSCTPTSTGTMYTISWGSSSVGVTYVDISENSNFSSWNYKYVGGVASTVASTGFGSLTFQPGKTYYIRTWNGKDHSLTATFTTPNVCPPPSATISGPASATINQTLNFSAQVYNGGSGSIYATRPDNASFTCPSGIVTDSQGRRWCILNTFTYSTSGTASFAPRETGTYSIVANAYANSTASFTASNATECTGNPYTYNTSQWSDCGSSDNITVNVLPPAPTCTEAYPSAATTTATSGSFRVYAVGVQNATEVKFPTWSEVNGQDDLFWYPGTNSGGGTWYADIDLARHPGLGWIRTHTYMNNSGYTNRWCDSADFQRILPPAPSLDAPTCPSPGTTANFSWSGNNAATSYYELFIDNKANPWGSYSTGNDSANRINSPGNSFSSTTFAGNTYGWWMRACNSAGCSGESYGPQFTCTLPNCNTNPDCDLCPAPANTCSANNGTTICYYRGYTGGGSCQVVSFTQNCTINKCYSGSTCINGTCVPPPPTASLSSPTNNSSTTIGQSMTVSATANGTNLRWMDIYRAPKDTQSWEKIAGGTCSGSSCSLSDSWTPAATDDGQWKIAVNAFDSYNQQCSGMEVTQPSYWTAYCGRNNTTSNILVKVVPPAPTNPSASCPIPGSTASLSWTGVNGASRYDVFVQDLAYGSLNWSTAQCGQNGLVVCQQVTSGTSYSFATTPGKNYQWYVFACNSGGCSINPASYSTTFSCTATPIPPTPSISTSPSCTPTNTNSMYTISWASSSPAVTYVDISTNSNFSTFYNKNVSGTSTFASSGFNLYGGSGSLTLQPNTTYHVRSWNGHANSSSSSFTTPNICLVTPSCNSPSSNSTISPDKVTFSWGPVPGASVYDFRLWNYTPWSETEITNGLTNTSYGPRNLSSGSSYAYRVSARNSGEIGPWATCSFSTSPPPQATISGPKTAIANGYPPTFTATLSGGAQSGEIWITKGDGLLKFPCTTEMLYQANSTKRYWCSMGKGTKSIEDSTLTGKYQFEAKGDYTVTVNAFNATNQTGTRPSNQCTGTPNALATDEQGNDVTWSDWSRCSSANNTNPPAYIQVTVSPPLTTTNCGGGVNPRAEGLVTTPSLIGQFGTSPEGRCIKDDPRTIFTSFKIPTYDELKSLYYTQSKASKELNADSVLSFTQTEDGKVFNYTASEVNIDNPSSYNKTAVIFIEGNLNINKNIITNPATPTKGLVFVVQKDVNIDKDVNQIDAIIISSGNIYTAGAACATSSVNVGAPTNALTVNGSLISLSPGKIVFCRTLNDNSRAAEKINNQPKYLVILSNLFASTLQKWSDITGGGSAVPANCSAFNGSPGVCISKGCSYNSQSGVCQ